jgi:hypothetical protein
MSEFSTVVAGWHEFYVMIGTAAATLMGLLFVSLSLNAHIKSGEENAGFRVLAVHTFSNFLFVLLVAIIFLIPLQSFSGLGIPLLLMGAAGLYGSVRRLFQARRVNKQAMSRTKVLRRTAGSGLCYLGLLAIAISVVRGQTRGLYWLVPVIIVLVGEASINAWILLIKVGGKEKDDR